MRVLAVGEPRMPLWRTIKAVAWSFVGLRGRSAYEQDVHQVRPLHLVAVALVAVFLFVGALMALVHWMVA